MTIKNKKLKTKNQKLKKVKFKTPDEKTGNTETLKEDEVLKRETATKSQKSPKSSKKIDAPQTMDELVALFGEKVKGFKKGEEIEGKITVITGKSMYFDINGKTEGVVLGREFEGCRDFIKTLKVGDRLKVRVGNPENERGQILLNLRQATRDHAWKFFEDKMKKQEAIAVRGKEINKGGLIVVVPYSLQGFVPGSQLGSKWQGKHQTLVNRTVKARVIEVDRKNNRLVFSEKLVSDADKIAAEKELLKKVKIGESYEAVITQVLAYGLMVEIQIPSKKPANTEAQKGLKRGRKKTVEATHASEPPRSGVTPEFSVSVLPGLVHISEISWSRVEDIKSLYQAGDKIKVKALRVEEGKLQLSVKQLASDPWEDLEKRYPQGEPIKGVVKRLEAYGALVEIEPGIEGLLHISKIPPDYQINAGDTISCFVELVNPKERKLSLGLVLKKKPVGYK